MSQRVKVLVGLLFLAVLMENVHGDTYSTFKTTLYHSQNRRYFAKVTPKKRITLYRNGSVPRHLWSRFLPALPGEVLVANDGSRIVVIDRYYGNGNDLETPVLLILDERGKDIARYALGELASSSKLIKTTSTSHWYSKVWFTSDESFLVIETVIAKYDPSTFKRPVGSEEAIDWLASVPYEHLKFSISTGKLTSRTRVTPLGNARN